MKTHTTSRAAWVVFSAGAFFFYSFIQMTLFSTEAMKTHFMGKLALESAADFGSFAGTFLYGTVLLLLPIGVLLDKISVRKTIIATLLLMVVCTFATAFTSDVKVAMALRFLMGVAHCVAFMAPFRLAPRWFPSSQLALVAGLVVTFAVFGGWVSGAPMLMLITALGGHSTLLVNGLLGVLILIIILIFVKDSPEVETNESSTGSLSLAEGLKLAAANKQNWLAGLFIGFLNLSVLLLGAIWGTTYLKFVNPDFSESTYTGIIGMIFIGTMIGSPACGWLSDKLQSRKKAMIGGAVMSLIVMLLIMFPLDTSAGYFYFIFLLLGLITSAQSIGYPVIGESNEDRVLGTANGLSAVVLMGMGAIGQPLFGWFVAQFGGAAGATPIQLQGAFQTAIWMMPVAFVGAILCAVFLRETFHKA
ncbi:MFS transporter [Reichenbachiella carrageenanivorans]|uniref:Lysosomal dipeptide transporter MFSD1 n=1 Tax=Reichenbachiella carrageenanivorans TaxID=2979869 RepID=A0ABY6D543_9BACT|nr:MFS transporter [Reichenbachiella carrageenanivorans]UXX81284.1 MFS transporter [Reichenbachiella carrageenanivorans]